MKKIIAVFMSLIMLLSFSGCAGLQERRDEKKYDKAAECEADGDYSEAYELFSELEDYSNSAVRAASCKRFVDYDAAVELMESGDYDGAYTSFSQLGAFYDSEQLAQECSDRVSIAEAQQLIADGVFIEAYELIKELSGYEEVPAMIEQCGEALMLEKARLLYDSGEYGDALNALAAYTRGEYSGEPEIKPYYSAYADVNASGNEEAKEMAEVCYNELLYADAMSYYESGEWDEAAESFTSLGDFKDSASMASDAQEKKAEEIAAAEAARQQQLADSYAAALASYNAGKYYSAYKAFSNLGNYSDAAAMASSCRQPMPGNGSMKTGSGSGCELTIYAPGGSQYVYLKVYTSGGAAAGSVFLAPGGSSTLYLGGGSYTIKAAYGTTWWGPTELFGDEGSYGVLTDQSGSTTFSLEYGSGYELQLMVSSGGNVGSRSINRSQF